MIDENAFGILVAHYDLESLEYSLEEDAFLEHVERFSELIDDRLVAQSPCSGLRRIELGHAVYLEFADGDQLTDPIVWVRSMRQVLIDADIPNVCVFTAGGRWLQAADEDADGEIVAESPVDARESGAWRVNSTDPDASNPVASPVPIQREADKRPDLVRERGSCKYGPSEPLRKALAAEAFAQPTTSGAVDGGWGPGLYVEKEAIEQLGKSLKNAPTELAALSSIFYRIGG